MKPDIRKAHHTAADKINIDCIRQGSGEFRLHHSVAPAKQDQAEVFPDAQTQINKNGFQTAYGDYQPDQGRLLGMGDVHQHKDGQSKQNQRHSLPAPNTFFIGQDIYGTDNPLCNARKLRRKKVLILSVIYGYLPYNSSTLP